MCSVYMCDPFYSFSFGIKTKTATIEIEYYWKWREFSAMGFHMYRLLKMGTCFLVNHKQWLYYLIHFTHSMEYGKLFTKNFFEYATRFHDAHHIHAFVPWKWPKGIYRIDEEEKPQLLCLSTINILQEMK